MAAKKILHLIDSIDMGGAEKLLCQTIAELKEFEHLIITLFPSNELSLLPSNAKHICLQAKSISSLPLKRNFYKRIIKEYQPHIVHAHLYFATVFAKWLTPTAVPLVFTQHFEFSKNAAKWYYAFTDRLVSKRSQTCIAISGSVLKDYLRATTFPGKVLVISNYIADKYFEVGKPGKTGKKEELKLVAVGNIKPIKNQQFILEAFEYLKDIRVSCDVYGEGTQRSGLEKQAKERHVNVYFKGSIEDPSTVLANYDMFIMPSLTEGFGLALFEAMAVGLPVVVSDIPVFHEVLDNKGNYISLTAPAQLRPIVERYIDNPSLLQQDGEEMNALAKAKAGKAVCLQKMRSLYNTILNGN